MEEFNLTPLVADCLKMEPRETELDKATAARMCTVSNFWLVLFASISDFLEKLLSNRYENIVTSWRSRFLLKIGSKFLGKIRWGLLLLLNRKVVLFSFVRWDGKGDKKCKFCGTADPKKKKVK